MHVLLGFDYNAGEELVTYDTEFGKVGLAICYDINTILPRYKPLNLWALLYSIAWVDVKPLETWFHNTLPHW